MKGYQEEGDEDFVDPGGILEQVEYAEGRVVFGKNKARDAKAGWGHARIRERESTATVPELVLFLKAFKAEDFKPETTPCGVIETLPIKGLELWLNHKDWTEENAQEMATAIGACRGIKSFKIILDQNTTLRPVAIGKLIKAIADIGKEPDKSAAETDGNKSGLQQLWLRLDSVTLAAFTEDLKEEDLTENSIEEYRLDTQALALPAEAPAKELNAKHYERTDCVADLVHLFKENPNLEYLVCGFANTGLVDKDVNTIAKGLHSCDRLQTLQLWIQGNVLYDVSTLGKEIGEKRQKSLAKLTIHIGDRVDSYQKKSGIEIQQESFVEFSKYLCERPVPHARLDLTVPDAWCMDNTIADADVLRHCLVDLRLKANWSNMVFDHAIQILIELSSNDIELANQFADKILQLEPLSNFNKWTLNGWFDMMVPPKHPMIMKRVEAEGASGHRASPSSETSSKTSQTAVERHYCDRDWCEHAKPEEPNGTQQKAVNMGGTGEKKEKKGFISRHDRDKHVNSHNALEKLGNNSFDDKMQKTAADRKFHKRGKHDLDLPPLQGRLHKGDMIICSKATIQKLLERDKTYLFKRAKDPKDFFGKDKHGFSNYEEAVACAKKSDPNLMQKWVWDRMHWAGEAGIAVQDHLGGRQLAKIAAARVRSLQSYILSRGYKHAAATYTKLVVGYPREVTGEKKKQDGKYVRKIDPGGRGSVLDYTEKPSSEGLYAQLVLARNAQLMDKPLLVAITEHRWHKCHKKLFYYRMIVFALEFVLICAVTTMHEDWAENPTNTEKHLYLFVGVMNAIKLVAECIQAANIFGLHFVGVIKMKIRQFFWREDIDELCDDTEIHDIDFDKWGSGSQTKKRKKSLVERSSPMLFLSHDMKPKRVKQESMARQESIGGQGSTQNTPEIGMKRSSTRGLDLLKAKTGFRLTNAEYLRCKRELIAYFDVWNILDWLRGTCVTLGAIFLLSDEPSWVRPLTATAMFAYWSSCLYFLLPFRLFGPLVITLLQIVYDVSGFLLLLTLMVFASTHIFYILILRWVPPDDSAPGFHHSLGFTLFATISTLLNFGAEGELDPNSLLETDRAVTSITLFVVLMTAVSVIMLNVFIAILSDSYEQIMDRRESELHFAKAKIIDFQGHVVENRYVKMFLTRVLQISINNTIPDQLYAVVPASWEPGDRNDVWQGALHAQKGELAKQGNKTLLGFKRVESEVNHFGADVRSDLRKVEQRLADMQKTLESSEGRQQIHP